MGLSKSKTESLLFMLKKRQIDLQVIGIDIENNLQIIDPKTGKFKTNPLLENVVNGKIKDIISIAKELVKRKQPAQISIANQHPLVVQKLQEAIQKSSLMKTTALPKAPKRLPKKTRRRI